MTGRKEFTLEERLVVALDVEGIGAAERLLDRLDRLALTYKIGNQLFTAAGPEVVRLVHQRGGRVFLDLKFHDIPNTVGLAVREAARLGVFMLNVHAAGGREMLRAAAKARDEAAGGGSARTRVIGVTVLTSLDAAGLSEIGFARPLEEQVEALARLSREAGLDGVVASGHEIPVIRGACGPDFLIVTPGVRPPWAEAHDQRRIATPAEAVRAGADFLVVGRPVLRADDPAEAVRRILEEMRSGICD